MTQKSPEARLLELIKKGGARPSAGAGKLWAEKSAAWGRGLASRWGSLTPWQMANRAAAAALLGVAGVVVHSWREVPFREAGGGAVEAAQGEEGRGLSLGDLTRRNLFRPLVSAPPPPAEKVEAPPPPPPPPKPPLSQRAAHLRLTGVLGGEPPQAVIEDRRRGGARYVAQGDALDEFRVEKVLSDRVILSADGETVELLL